MQLINIKRITTLFVAAVLCNVTLFSQITQPAGVVNYVVKKEAVTDATQIATLTNAEKIVAINYIDGLGRPLQSIIAAGSPGGKDIVSFSFKIDPLLQSASFRAIRCPLRY